MDLQGKKIIFFIDKVEKLDYNESVIKDCY